MTRPNESDPDKAPGLDAERARRARALLKQDDLDRAFPISKELTILLCYAIMMSVGFLIRSYLSGHVAETLDRIMSLVLVTGIIVLAGLVMRAVGQGRGHLASKTAPPREPAR